MHGEKLLLVQMSESRPMYKWVTNAFKGAINWMPIHVTAWSGVRLRPIDIWDCGFESRRERIVAVVIF
jgi:hypothetical protein